LKPANLLLRDGEIDRVVVLDFGVARRHGTSQAMTRTGVIVGTPDYMAPEQAQGRRALTAAVDVFALGTILFQCLTGASPFAGGDVAAVLAKILFGPIPDLRELRPEIPAAVATLAARMLSRSVEDRPKDARVLLMELDELLLLPLAELDALGVS